MNFVLYYLCNFIYKVISKVLANRLSTVLPSLISHNQSGFVKGRMICENVLLAHELVRGFHCIHGPKKFCVKVDLRKAFDKAR